MELLWCLISTLFILSNFIIISESVELTFELPDNAKECFHQEIGKNVTATLEFQVSNSVFFIDILTL